MNLSAILFQRHRNRWLIALVVSWLVSTTCFCQAKITPSTMVGKWGIFDREFRSSTSYANPLQNITLGVEFTSPQGEKTTVNGFWDGGRIWKVRFSPDLPGKWAYQTSCSDTANTNLHKIKGEFLCITTTGKSRFDLHGPVQISRDQLYLEHQDHTPFLWLADTAWQGALLSKSTEWETYAEKRAKQNFTVTQWMAAPSKNLRNQTAFVSTGTSLTINPAFFQQLDLRIETLNHAGLLSAILPLKESGLQGAVLESIPEDQAVQLLQYMVARWGAYKVAWVVLCEGDNLGTQVARWKRIGRIVFGNQKHAPVVLHPGATYWVLDQFRTEPWTDVFGYESGQQTNDDSLQWLLAGPLSADWQQLPAKPFINLAPAYESIPVDDTTTAQQSAMVRRVTYWSLLNAPPAGVSYGADGVWNWLQSTGSKRATSSPSLPVWQKNLSMPVAQQMKIISDTFSSIDFWQLRPAPEILVAQPGNEHPTRHISPAQSPNKDLTLVYIPEDRSVDLVVNTLPNSPKAEWINARTGEHLNAVEYVGGSVCRFITPTPGDWLLVIRPEK